jgi:hypothetical protein
MYSVPASSNLSLQEAGVLRSPVQSSAEWRSDVHGVLETRACEVNEHSVNCLHHLLLLHIVLESGPVSADSGITT